MAPLLEQDLEGFWGPPTSTVDWCEANYEVSYYVAEFWNTVTNVFLIFPQLIAAYLCFLGGIDQRYTYCFLSLSVIGFGSLAFHGTLYFTMQLMDELPIIWSTTVMLYCLLRNASPPKSKNPSLALVLTLYCVIDTMTYISWQNYTFFLVSHAVLIFSLIYYSRKMMRHIHHKKEYYQKGIFFYAFGFSLWMVDRLCCASLGKMRLALGPYLAPLLQLHGWWHLLAATGTFYAVIFCLEMRLNYLKRNYKIERVLGIWPFPRAIVNNN